VAPPVNYRSICATRSAGTPCATRTGKLDHPAREEPVEKQILLFAPISAVPRDGSGDPAWLLEGAVSPEPVTDAALTIPLPPLPVSVRPQQARPHDGRTRREQTECLRRANAETAG
jgi:hypothetical protein